MSTKIWQWDDVIDGVDQLCDEVQLYQDTLKSSIGTDFEKDVRYKIDYQHPEIINSGKIVLSDGQKYSILRIIRLSRAGIKLRSIKEDVSESSFPGKDPKNSHRS